MRTAHGWRLSGYLVLAAVGLLAGVVLGRPEPVVLGLPFLLTVLVALALLEQPVLEADVSLDRERLLEGERLKVGLDLSCARGTGWVELRLLLPRSLEVVEGMPRQVLSLAAGRRHLEFVIEAKRWGGYSLGGAALRVRDPLGFFSFSTDLGARRRIRVYPLADHLRSALRPARTQGFSGNEVSRLKGEGIEFADIRSFLPGDRVRAVNWRVSARRQAIHVNEFHPERNADVVIFLDTFSDVRGGDVSTLEMAVRGAAGLAGHYLQRRDRVGMIGFGGTLRWLQPGMGARQLYRIVDSLIDTEVVLSYAWKGLEVIPHRILPPGSLVVALTPMLDERIVLALLDLRGRGHDLNVVEVAPEELVASGTRETERLAYKLWQLERDALRFRFQSLGVPVAIWKPGQPIQGALEEVREFRRCARLARV